jgi:hypothetical protein
MKLFLSLLIAVLFAAPVFADNDRECGIVGGEIDPTEAGATDDFINLAEGDTFETTAAAADGLIVPVAVTAWGLNVIVDVAATVNDEWTVSVVDDTVASVLSCVITGAAGVSCTSDSYVDIAAGSKLTVLVDSDTGTADPAAAALMSVAFCLDVK